MPFVTGNTGPPAVGFTPTSITGCALWIDGADTTAISMTLSGSNVTQWNDKSGNNNNFTLGSTYIKTNVQNGLPSVYFNGSNYMSNASLSVNSSNHTGFIIAIADNITGTSLGFSANLAGIVSFVNGTSMSSEDSGAYSYRYYVNYGGNLSGFDMPNNGFRLYTPDVVPYTPTIICEQFQNGTGGLFLNGTVPNYQYTQPTMPSGFPNTSGCLLGLQWMGNAQRYYQGCINEMIIYNVALTTTQRQNVEGYLAQKWGLTASLPNGHPGLTNNYLISIPRVFRIGPLPGNRTPFSVTANPFVPPLTLSVLPDARYSFLTAPSGTITNTGSSGSIGTATISSATYTSTAPSYITFARGTGYILAPSITGIRTLILIVRVTNASAPAYLLDARTGLGGGWLYSSTGTDHIGTDWTSATYYRDTVNTTFSGNFILALQDSTWHHVCLQRASFTSAITFLARISQNETLGCDCGEIMIFTGALTAQQVKDNYNFFSSRFGWTPV